MLWFRYAMGSFTLGCGIIFLFINSNILARGAMRWAQAGWDQYAYATVAALCPWIIAIMPFAIAACVVLRRWGWCSMAVLLYAVFTAYNWIGAGGAVAIIRNDVVSEHRHVQKTERGREDRRKALVTQRDAIAAGTRPVAQLEGLQAAERAKALWTATDRCEEAKGGRQRAFCTAYAALVAEAGAARRLEELDGQIAAIDGALEKDGPVTIKSDPQVEMLAWLLGWSGMTAAAIEKWLPLATPTILELGAMFLLGLSFMLFGWNHKLMILGREYADKTPRVPKGKGGASAPPNLTAQLELAEWFFRECARPAEIGSMPETKWYGLYEQLCRSQSDAPLPVEAFRRIARKANIVVGEVGGQIVYQKYLPYMPAVRGKVA